MEEREKKRFNWMGNLFRIERLRTHWMEEENRS